MVGHFIASVACPYSWKDWLLVHPLRCSVGPRPEWKVPTIKHRLRLWRHRIGLDRKPGVPGSLSVFFSHSLMKFPESGLLGSGRKATNQSPLQELLASPVRKCRLLLVILCGSDEVSDSPIHRAQKSIHRDQKSQKDSQDMLLRLRSSTAASS